MKTVSLQITEIDRKVKTNLTNGNTYIPSQADVVFKWLPLAYVLTANQSGTKTSNSLFTRVIIIVLSQGIVNSVILPLKKVIDRRRPDSLFKYNSFPSRHTAVSFAGAEILRRELKDNNRIIALTGYAAAITTGSLRIYRRKHWLTDVIAGAVVGIIAASLSYRIYNRLKRN